MDDKYVQKLTDNCPIEEIYHFNTRIINSLRTHAIDTVGKLMSLGHEDLAELPNIGRLSLRTINQFKEKYDSLRKSSVSKKESHPEERKYEISQEDFFTSQNKESYKLFCDFMEKFFDHKFVLFRKKILNLEEYIQSKYIKIEQQLRTTHANEKKDFEEKVTEITKIGQELSIDKDRLINNVVEKMNGHYYALQAAFNDFVKLKNSESEREYMVKTTALELKIKELEEKIAALFFGNPNK